MTLPSRFSKSPAELLDYKIDYASELAKTGDTLQTSLWVIPSNSVDSSGNTAIALADGVIVNEDPVSPSPSFSLGGTEKTTAAVTVFLSGGTLGNVYRVQNRVTTIQGRKYSRIIEIVIEPKYA
jgi:hypothetical protein